VHAQLPEVVDDRPAWTPITIGSVVASTAGAKISVSQRAKRFIDAHAATDRVSVVGTDAGPGTARARSAA